jgi:hypothetical protein
MTVPSYTEDLTDFNLAEDTTDWDELSAGNYDGQGALAADTDYQFIQGQYAVTQICTKSALGSAVYDAGTGTGGHGTDGAYLVWQMYGVNSNLQPYSSGGFGIAVGSSLANFKVWHVGGVDVPPYPAGGWVCNAVNTTVTRDVEVGSPTATEQVVGSTVNVATGSGKGYPHGCDAIRYGRCSSIFEYGETADYCTIDGFATEDAYNDGSNGYNRWGLIVKVLGGYLWQGKMTLGTVSNAVDFRDSDRIVLVKWCPKVTANFNTIEVNNASSRVDMTNFQFICIEPSTNASIGRWITNADADINLDNCSFQDMGTFTFDSNTVAVDCTWTRCLQIDPGGGDLSFASILESAVTGGGSAGGGALLWNEATDPNTYINDSVFTKGAGSHHAIEFGTSAPTTINLTNMTFTGFNASDQQTDSVLYFPDTGSDVTWTVAHTGTTGAITYYKARTGDTVNISSSVVVTVNVVDTDGNDVNGARVGVYKTSDRTEIINEDTVSGVATENYTGSTPVQVEVRARKASSADSPKYKNYSSIQTIGVSGLTMTVTLVEDPNNNATT